MPEADLRQIIKTFGWDSQEFKDWKAEDAEAQYPLTRGECDAYRAWRSSNLRGNDELELDDSVWEKDMQTSASRAASAPRSRIRRASSRR